MMKKAVLFGSIGAIIETSDIQRRAYNAALREAGLSWVWDRATYAQLLEQSGGKDRLALLAAATGVQLTVAQIDAIHARKTEIACQEIVKTKPLPRPGVLELAKLAQFRGLRLGFVTTTYQPNIDAIFVALGDTLRPSDFDHIVDREKIAHGKPAPDAYNYTLEALGVAASDAIAIEDTALSVMAAKRAGITTVATPGDISTDQDFWQADLVLPALSIRQDELHPQIIELLG